MSDSATSMVTSATSAVMDMASATMSMTMSSSTSSSSGMAMEGMDHGSSHMAMNMWLTASFKDYPVVFKDLELAPKLKLLGYLCCYSLLPSLLECWNLFETILKKLFGK